MAAIVVLVAYFHFLLSLFLICVGEKVGSFASSFFLHSWLRRLISFDRWEHFVDLFSVLATYRSLIVNSATLLLARVSLPVLRHLPPLGSKHHVIHTHLLQVSFLSA